MRGYMPNKTLRLNRTVPWVTCIRFKALYAVVHRFLYTGDSIPAQPSDSGWRMSSFSRQLASNLATKDAGTPLFHV